MMLELETNQMTTQIITKLLEDAIKVSWDKIANFFKDMGRQASIDFGVAYEQYLENTWNKYSKIKTIIYRRVPKDLYSFYECIGVLHGNKKINTENVNNLIDVDNKIIITGTGGIGKSILFKHLYLNSILNTQYIPVLIELRSFNSIDRKDISLRHAIYNNLCNYGFKLEEQYFDYSMENGGYIILLDGFDEVNRDRTEVVGNEIRELCNRYNLNHYIISSRPSEKFIGWNDFVEMSALSLTKEQALSLISKIEFDENIKKIFYKELDEELYDKYYSFASNPLLLNIMLLTFNNHASIPDKLNDFYEQAFSTLYNMHDATKEAYVRDIRTGLGCEDFKSIFSYICFKSYFLDEYEFTDSKIKNYINKAKNRFEKFQFSIDDFLEDLTMSVCMLVKEGINYRFAHRSFQEYFAALYTCKLTDKVQENLLTNWLRESDSVGSDSYFKMLFNLQGEKVNKIVFAPGLKEIKKAYKSWGFSIKLLELLFSHISVRDYYLLTDDAEIKEKNTKKRFFLRIKNRYLCNILSLTCQLNEYAYDDQTNELEDEVMDILDNRSNELPTDSFDYFTLDKAVEIVGEQKLLDALQWVKYEIEFAINIFDNCFNNSINRKKKVITIIEEL